MSSPVKIEHSPRTKPSVHAQCTSQAASSVMVRVRSHKPSLHVKSAYGVKSMVSSLQCPACVQLRCQVHGVMSMVSGPSESKVCQVQVCQVKSVYGVKSSSATPANEI